jgi:hypothetical protein
VWEYEQCILWACIEMSYETAYLYN